ncbi:MAG TPA: TspO/MBR family protein [Burkholderiaceae bacterium]|nr:TspO/MBR family protein [Burkholderiaceae bacterium]
MNAAATTRAAGAALLQLAGWVALTTVAASLGAFASVQAGAFYAQLDRPAWAPPGWLFGPVWSALYLMMAVAAWRIGRAGRGDRIGRFGRHDRVGGIDNIGRIDRVDSIGRISKLRPAPALSLYVLQLAVNALWSWLFFAWHFGMAAFACIVVLWLLIVATIVLFGRRDRLAALLLWPYLAWVSFATVLCFSVWRRNPALLG